MGHLEEDARAIPGVLFATASPAMVQVDKDIQGLADDLVGLLAFDVHEEPDPAGIMLMLRVVKSLLWRRLGYLHKNPIHPTMLAIVFLGECDRALPVLF